MARSSCLKIGVGLVIVSLMAGVAPTVIGMMNAFNHSASGGSIDEKQLSESVASGLRWSMISIPLALVGVSIFVVGLVSRPEKNHTSIQTDDATDTSAAGNS